LGIVTNSSAATDSRLSVVTPDPWAYGSVLAGSTAPGARKLSLALAGGGSLTLTNINTYNGDTTITAGTLALAGIGAIANSTPVILSSGTTLDASARTDATLTVMPGQTLKGDGAFNVTGNLINNGTLELKLNKAGATLTNDSINGLTAITYGGTLKLAITASPALNTGDSFKLFNSTAYAGNFPTIVPPVPVYGLAWDTGTLATDGTLRIKTGPVTTATNLTALVTGGGANLQLSWPANHIGWRIQSQSNSISVGLSTNWVDVPGTAETNQISMPINPANGAVFYRMVYP
jgi:autotransporter-associated beta strand protein